MGRTGHQAVFVPVHFGTGLPLPFSDTCSSLSDLCNSLSVCLTHLKLETIHVILQTLYNSHASPVGAIFS